MQILTPKVVASSRITVTNSAQQLFALMDSAGSTQNSESYYAQLNANALIITPEDGNIRCFSGANPTSTQGTLLSQGVTYTIPGVNLSDFRLIRTGGSNVACTVELYKSQPGESWAAVSPGNNITVNADTEFPAASAITDNYANPTTTDVKSFGMLWDGSNWDKWYGDSTYGAKVQDTTIPQAFDNTVTVIKAVNAPLTGSTYTWSSDSSSALEASSVVKASAGTVRKFSGYVDASLASGTYYLQFFNQTSVPADTTAIAANFIAPNVVYHTTGVPTPINLDFTDNCVAFSTGLAWCLSSTAFTKTITSAVVSATVLYK
jgi:hypothetical protein